MWPATHLALPGSPRLLGYFPGSRLGFGEDLPPGVAIEWASWCRHPRYLVGALGVEDAMRACARRFAPTRSATIRSRRCRAVEALLELYPNARWRDCAASRRATLGAKRIGHFGFFRERFRDSLWREAADWLERTMKELKGKVAAVTGAASGLGRAMALAFADEGMHLALADVDEAESTPYADRRLGDRRERSLDAASTSPRRRSRSISHRRVVSELGGVHVVCNNAGVSPLGAGVGDERRRLAVDPRRQPAGA